jgi:tetratricopeptide (TPR) repeat protein
METFNITKRTSQSFLLLALSAFTTGAIAQGQIDPIVEAGVQRTEAAASSQGRIDMTQGETDKLISEYKRQLKVIDGLKVYNSLLQRQLDSQVSDMGKLRNSIDEVAIIERQITPTMIKMLDSLDSFIQADVPFLMDDRNKRIANLRAAVESADFATAEKFRAVLDAYNIEGDYGRTIEAYSGALNLDGVEREVSFLKIGRITLIYQTSDRQTNGVWDQGSRSWVTIEDEAFRNYIAKGLQIAREQIAPDMIVIPLVASEIK